MVDRRNIDLSVSCYGITKDIDYDLVVLPWGSTEPHNYHLPYLTDCLLSRDIAVDAAELAWQRSDVHCMVMPPVPYGMQNPGQHDLPFCIHTRHATQMAILEDIVASLYRQGMRKLLILNGHGGNDFKAMVRDMAFRYPDFLILAGGWYNIIPNKDHFEEVIDDHAGEQETSVLMHYHPELVDLSLAGDGELTPFAIESLNKKVAWVPRNWAKATKDTGVGNPKKSTAGKGKHYAEAVIEKLATLFEEVARKELY